MDMIATSPTPTVETRQAIEPMVRTWLDLPEEDRAELLDGQIIYKAMSRPEHGDAMGAVFSQLSRLRGPPREGRGGWWLSQDVRMYLAGQGLRPDVVGWRVERLPHPPRLVNIDGKQGVVVDRPDWVCEVLSRSTQHRDRKEGAKWRAHYKAGVEHYWLVDLWRQTVTVYERGPRRYELAEVAERGEVKPLPPFESVEFITEDIFLMLTEDEP